MLLFWQYEPSPSSQTEQLDRDLHPLRRPGADRRPHSRAGAVRCGHRPGWRQPISSLPDHANAAAAHSQSPAYRQPHLSAQGFHLSPDAGPAGKHPCAAQPYLILDLLGTFHDENVPTPEVSRLLDRCLAQMDRLRLEAPVIVSLGSSSEERLFLFERVCSHGDQTINIEVPYPVIAQPSLF